MSYLYIVFIKLLLLLLLVVVVVVVVVFYCQDSFCSVPIVTLMASSISTLVDLWHSE